MTENMTTVLETIRDTIGKVEERRDAAAAEMRDADAELRRLRTAERALSPTAAAGPRKGSNRDAALAIMQELKHATQFEVALRLGRPKNTARTALDQLVKAGLVVRTGEQKRRSPVFALAEDAAA